MGDSVYLSVYNTEPQLIRVHFSNQYVFEPQFMVTPALNGYNG